MRLGVDVGGTNTDAVIIGGGRILGAAKTPTTDPSSEYGVAEAVREALRSAGARPSQIEAATLGTTQVTNALAERRRLSPAAVLRICLPANRSLKPMIDWPPELRAEIGDHVFEVRGGYEFYGAEAAPLDEAAVIGAAREMREARLSNIAVVGLFSPVNAAQERRAAGIIRQEFPEAAVTLSSEIGGLGFIERENAAILNAALGDLALGIVAGFETTLIRQGAGVPVYITQNNGSIMSAEAARRYPVLMARSGPTNSMRGAVWLTGESDAVVADIGGTTTDVGLLQRGEPHERALAGETGGVRTNFRMPDVVSLALGGGSIINPGPPLSIGPFSVQGALRERALVFGGDTPTASDVAARLGRMTLGDVSRAGALSLDEAREAGAVIKRRIEDAIDRVKLSAAPVTAVIVGGGAGLAPPALEGAGKVMIPAHGDVANAIGAAVARIGGEADLVLSYDEAGRGDALQKATRLALERAAQAGAPEDAIEIVDIEEIPLAYMPGGARRVRVRAAASFEGAAGRRS
jgi:N-methylhydantoinase A/oxoprolinase/acetone carboxylase beta subunit